MSCQLDNQLTTYHPLLSYSSEPFPFFDLPLLVQSKILKQYVSVFTKIHTLDQIPQFSELLHYRSSWLNTSNEFAELIQILRLIQEGIYVPIEDKFPNHGYYVSKGTTTITFTLISFTNFLTSPSDHKLWETNVSTPVVNLIKFLEYFLNQYCMVTNNPLLTYKYESLSCLYVNSFDSRYTEIRKHGFFRSTMRCEIIKKSDISRAIWIETIYHPIYFDLSDIDTNIRLGNTESLKEDAVTRRLCKIDISLGGKKDIAVHVSTSNTTICQLLNNKDLLNTLSEKIVIDLLEKT